MSLPAATTASPSALGSFTPEAFTAHLAAQGAAPAWWLERKRTAYAKFAALPMPRRTDEFWRFSNIGALNLDGFNGPDSHAADDGGASASDRNGKVARINTANPFRNLSFESSASLHFNNNTLVGKGPGHVSAELAGRGVIVTTLSDAAVRHADLLKAHFMAQPQKLGSEKFAALHTAFVGDGAFIHVPRGVEIPSPIVIWHTATGENSSVFPHTLVIAEEQSKVTVIDLFTSVPTRVASSPGGVQSGEARQLACGANDLYAGHGAQLTYVAAQNWSRDTLSFQFNSTVVRRDARVQSLNLHLGARQARHESLSQLQAPGAFSEMLALTVAEGTQEFDQRTLQVHQAPNTKSDLLYKNALRDATRTIFSGLIVVDPDAQKTDAYQSNRNLMLSDDAEASSLPGLEIQANDVRCTHGATSSRIDAEQEFYLQTRGIDKEAADELLTFGFFEEVLSRLASEELHEALRELIKTKFRK